jgi:hypothetical protein
MIRSRAVRPFRRATRKTDEPFAAGTLSTTVLSDADCGDFIGEVRATKNASRSDSSRLAIARLRKRQSGDQRMANQDDRAAPVMALTMDQARGGVTQHPT